MRIFLPSIAVLLCACSGGEFGSVPQEGSGGNTTLLGNTGPLAGSEGQDVTGDLDAADAGVVVGNTGDPPQGRLPQGGSAGVDAGGLGGGGGTAGEGGAGGAGGAGGESNSDPEICDNGKDDNDDGLVDCDDPDCGAFTCAAVPADWSGPVVLRSGTLNAVPACSGDYDHMEFLLGVSPNTAPATCPSCSCNANALSCGTGDLYSHMGDQCGGPGSGFDEPWVDDNICYYFDIASGEDSLSASFHVSGGNCTPVESGSVVVPSAKWNSLARGCATQQIGAGCATDALCVPKASKLCIYRSGDHSCPPAYPSAQTYYDDAMDNRTCSACNCDSPSCTGSYTLYSDKYCGATPVALSGDGAACTAFDDAEGDGVMSARFSGGSVACDPNPGQPMGTVIPSGPNTVCCTE